MYITFQISCRACDRSFELDSEHFTNRETLCCPNCGQPFPERELRQLKTAMAALREISEVCAASSSDKGFVIHVTGAGNSEELPF